MSEKEPRPISELKPENYDNAVDLRGTPTHVCICGCFVWNVKCVFKDYEMSYHYTDMECAKCGSLATTPTPSHMPEGYVSEYGCLHDNGEHCSHDDSDDEDDCDCDVSTCDCEEESE